MRVLDICGFGEETDLGVSDVATQLNRNRDRDRVRDINPDVPVFRYGYRGGG